VLHTKELQERMPTPGLQVMPLNEDQDGIKYASKQMDREGTMKLCYAAAAGNMDELKSLLAAKHDPNLADFDARTPLHVASSRAGLVEIVGLLLAHRAQVNRSDHWGRTPLSLAQAARDFDVMKLLQDNGAKVQQTRLSRQANDNFWQLDRTDLHLGKELSATLKSVVHLATWRGTEVVVKCAKIQHGQMVRAFSGNATATSQSKARTHAPIALCVLPTSQHQVRTSDGHPRAPADDIEEAMHDEFLHEIELLASLRHPDLVMFLGACLQEKPIIFVTEYMPGGDLDHYYRNKRKQNNGIWQPRAIQVVDWSMAIARALSFLHKCTIPVVHRDLKPLNLLLNKNLEIKMADFRISKMVTRVTDRSHYKMTGGVGSWLYMAPEVVRYQNYDEKVDIYSFALIMYFMSSGREPFHEIGEDPELVLKQYLQGNEPRPNLSECHPLLRAIMSKAWHVDASSRPSAEELLKLLRKSTATSQPTCACNLM